MVEEWKVEYQKLPWEKKIDLECELSEIVETLKTMETFYNNLQSGK